MALAALLAGFAMLGVVPGTSTSAAALVGCPPQSSVCNPVGLGLMAMSDGTLGIGAAGSGAVVSTTATATTGTVVAGGGSGAAGGVASALVGFLAGIGLGHFIWGNEPPPELTMQDGLEAGWVGGNNIATMESSAYGYKKLVIEYEIISAPAYGVPGAINYRARCLVEEGSGQGSLAFPAIRRVLNGVSVGNLAGPQCVNQGGGVYTPGSWVYYTFEVTHGSGLAKIAGAGVEWRPAGHPDGQPPAIEGQIGTVTTTIECINAAGAVSTFTSSQLVQYAPGAAFETPAISCPEGRVLYGYGVTWTPAGGGAPEVIIPWTVTPEWVHSVPVEYPGCVDPAAPCELRLFIQTPQGLEYCGVAAIGCPSWWLDPSKLERYQCMWGPYTVELGACNVFRTPGQVKPNVQLEQEPKNGAWHAPGGAPNWSLDPEGLPEIPPELQGPGVPAPAPAPDPTALDDSSACFPSGWGVFNPAEWVLKPVKCALVWAFVPRPEVVTDLAEQLRADVLIKPPFSIAMAAPPLIEGMLEGAKSGDCFFGDWTPWYEETLTIPCEAPAGWTPVYSAATVAIWAGGLWQAARMIMAGFGNREAA